MSKYFKYEKGVFSTTSERPSNQNSKRTLKGLNGKYTTLDDNPSVSLPTIGEQFYELTPNLAEGKKVPLADSKIDIAHGISIANIMKVLAGAMNAKMAWPSIETDVLNFGKSMLSGNDQKDFDEKLGKLINFFKNIPAWTPTKLMSEADKIARLLNNAINNLMAGNRSTNRSIGSENDPELTLVVLRPGEAPILTTLPEYSKIKKAFDKLASILDVEISHADEQYECKSSSASRNPDLATFQPAMFPDKAKEIIEEQYDWLEEALEDERLYGVDLSNSKPYEKLLNDFDNLNNPDTMGFIDQHPGLRESRIGILYDQSVIAIREEYKATDIPKENLPSSLREQLYPDDTDDEDDINSITSDEPSDDDSCSDYILSKNKSTIFSEKDSSQKRVTVRRNVTFEI